MQAQMQEVIDLQQHFNAKNTPEMQRRGELIRRAIPADLAASAKDRLARALGPHGADVDFEGRDGTGMKTYVPWVRFFSRAQTESAQEGWYCVYLFEASGRGVYLALAHGSTTFEDGEFKPKPAEQLAELVAWGRAQVADAIAADPQIAEPMILGGKTLADAYERSTVVAKWYASGAIPDDETLYADAERFALLLRRIYDGDALGRAPHSLPPEAAAVEQFASGNTRQNTGQGFGLTTAERRAVERHAMAIAEHFLKQERWSVQDVSADRPYDLLCRRGRDELIVEVKGTTARGDRVLVTRGEVTAHRKHYPNNALIVVHSISLARKAEGPEANGGTLVLFSPWEIQDEQLSPVAYMCRLPEA